MLGSVRSLVRRIDPIGSAFRGAGVAMAATGIAHFVAPRAFVALSKPVFHDDTEKWVQINGATETAIGLAFLDRRTRPYGLIGVLAYGAFLGDRAFAAFTRESEPE